MDHPFTREELAPAVWALAAGVLGLHVVTAARYGYFGDELYFLACARRLAWSYVDLVPASIALLRCWTAIAGESLRAIRVVPALAGAATILVTARLAQRLGGGVVAQTIAALAAAISPGLLIVDHYYSMNALDPLLWGIAALSLLRALDGDRPGPWIALGVVLAVGVSNRVTVLGMGGGLAIGLALAQPRSLRTPGPWTAAAIVLAAAVPIAVWQSAHGWPTVEFVRNVVAYKLAPVTLGGFWRNQILLVHPVAFAIAMLGLARLLAGPAAPLGVAYLTMAALLLGIGASRAYYLLAAYPPLLAAGAVAIGEAAHGRPRLAVGFGLALVVSGLASLPLALPILPVDGLIAYEQAIGFESPTEDLRVTGPLPGHFANMHGWPEIVTQVRAAAASLAQPSRAVVLSEDYMEAGALEVLGGDLPPVVGTHDSWAVWSPAVAAPDEVVLVGAIADRASTWFDDVRVVARIDCSHCLPWRVGRPIAIARAPRVPFARVLAEIRHFD